MRDPDVHGWPLPWIVIKRSHPKNQIRLTRSFRSEMRAARGAKSPNLPGDLRSRLTFLHPLTNGNAREQHEPSTQRRSHEPFDTLCNGSAQSRYQAL
jgi:hypothetical protein